MLAPSLLLHPHHLPLLLPHLAALHPGLARLGQHHLDPGAERLLPADGLPGLLGGGGLGEERIPAALALQQVDVDQPAEPG